MKSAVIVFPGSNCDRDAYVALKNVSGHDPLMVWHDEVSLPDVDLIVVPGGFTYGDYLRTGAIAAKSKIMAEVIKAANAGKYVLGVCNGFQILTESGLLPGVLMRNKNLKFSCKTVNLKVENQQTFFTKSYKEKQVITVPIAHGEGNYFADPETIKYLNDNNMVAFRYCDASGNINDESNPNGSIENIAGITNKNGNVLGMMPHPERVSDSNLRFGTDGQLMFAGFKK